MASCTRKEVLAALKDAGAKKVSEDILTKCFNLSSTLHLTPAQMTECWEVYSLNKQITELDDHSFAGYRLQLVKESNVELTAADGAVASRPKREPASVLVTPAANKRQHQQDSTTNSNKTNSSNSSGNRRVSLSPGAPLPTMGKLTEVSNRPKFSERKNIGDIVATFNPKEFMAIDSSPTSSSSTPKCTVEYNAFATNVAEPYRHMFTVLEERAQVLDAMLLEKHDDFAERYNFGSEQMAELESVGIPRQEKVCNVGRICNVAHEGRINAKSIVLEGSRHMSGGARVDVDLEPLKSEKDSFSLFPGQIVAIEGMNSSGRKLVAQRICEGVPHSPVTTSVSKLLKYHHSDEFQDGKPVKIVSASGPFTCSDNLDYEPLVDLIDTVSKMKPDVVILTGPFVDVRHKAVAAGQTTLQFEDSEEEIIVSYEAFFANKVAILLEDFYNSDESIQTQFVLVPSLDDATTDWVYPQAPFRDSRQIGMPNPGIPGGDGVDHGTMGLHHIETASREGGGPRRVHCVSNPCTLMINELVVGVSATDVLFQISADETNANLVPGSRLCRIAQHMVQQRSYYPLFPGPCNMDLKRMDQWKMPCAPDLLILPSKLSPFARTVLGDATLVVNPGHLAKDRTGGTYAVMDLHPVPRDTLENAGGDDVELPHAVGDRTRVEVKRI